MAIAIQENISLKPYNSFGFEQTARYFTVVTTLQQLQQALAYAESNDLELLMIGGGSNLIITADITGLVVLNRIRGHEIKADGLITAGAGENWHEFVRWTLEQGWYGLENLSLIPGTVGAAPMQNIGAYGVEIKDRMHSLEALDIKTGAIVQFSCEDCRFGYRDSIFKSVYPGRYLILSVTFRLSRAFVPVLNYGGISGVLEERGISEPTPLQLSDLICEIRNAKLPQPEQIGNAGSFFKNPVIPQAQAETLQQRFPSLVSFADQPGYRKLAAGWLIDQLGWKGKKKGAAGVYEKQALVLVNHGGATGTDILSLAEQIRQSVNEQFGIELEIEPRTYPDKP